MSRGVFFADNISCFLPPDSSDSFPSTSSGHYSGSYSHWDYAGQQYAQEFNRHSQPRWNNSGGGAYVAAGHGVGGQRSTSTAGQGSSGTMVTDQIVYDEEFPSSDDESDEEDGFKMDTNFWASSHQSDQGTRLSFVGGVWTGRPKSNFPVFNLQWIPNQSEFAAEPNKRRLAKQLGAFIGETRLLLAPYSLCPLSPGYRCDLVIGGMTFTSMLQAHLYLRAGAMGLPGLASIVKGSTHAQVHSVSKQFPLHNSTKQYCRGRWSEPFIKSLLSNLILAKMATCSEFVQCLIQQRPRPMVYCSEDQRLGCGADYSSFVDGKVAPGRKIHQPYALALSGIARSMHGFRPNKKHFNLMPVDMVSLTDLPMGHPYAAAHGRRNLVVTDVGVANLKGYGSTDVLVLRGMTWFGQGPNAVQRILEEVVAPNQEMYGSVVLFCEEYTTKPTVAKTEDFIAFADWFAQRFVGGFPYLLVVSTGFGSIGTRPGFLTGIDHLIGKVSVLKPFEGIPLGSSLINSHLPLDRTALQLMFYFFARVAPFLNLEKPDAPSDGNELCEETTVDMRAYQLLYPDEAKLLGRMNQFFDTMDDNPRIDAKTKRKMILTDHDVGRCFDSEYGASNMEMGSVGLVRKLTNSVKTAEPSTSGSGTRQFDYTVDAGPSGAMRSEASSCFTSNDAAEHRVRTGANAVVGNQGLASPWPLTKASFVGKQPPQGRRVPKQPKGGGKKGKKGKFGKKAKFNNTADANTPTGSKGLLDSWPPPKGGKKGKGPKPQKMKKKKGNASFNYTHDGNTPMGNVGLAAHWPPRK